MRIQDLLERQAPISVDAEANNIMDAAFYDQLDELEGAQGLVAFCNLLNRVSTKFGITFEAAPKMATELDGNAYENGEIKISLKDSFRVKLQDSDTQDDSLNRMRSLVVHELVHREQGARSQGRAFFEPRRLKKISDPKHSDLADAHEIRAYADHIVDYLRNTGFSDRDIAQAVQYQPQRLNQSPQWQLYQKVFGSHDPYRTLNKLKKTIMDLVAQ